MPDRKATLAGSVALLVMGLLVLIPSGLCTGMVLISQLRLLRDWRNGGLITLSLPALVFGGPFIAIGAALTWKGIKGFRARRDRKDRETLS